MSHPRSRGQTARTGPRTPATLLLRGQEPPSNKEPVQPDGCPWGSPLSCAPIPRWTLAPQPRLRGNPSPGGLLLPIPAGGSHGRCSHRPFPFHWPHLALLAHPASRHRQYLAARHTKGNFMGLRPLKRWHRGDTSQQNLSSSAARATQSSLHTRTPSALTGGTAALRAHRPLWSSAQAELRGAGPPGPDQVITVCSPGSPASLATTSDSWGHHVIPRAVLRATGAQAVWERNASALTQT